MTIDIKQLRALLAAATPGPWSEGVHGNANVVHFDGDDIRAVAEADASNAALICAAVNALPELLDEVEWLRVALESDKFDELLERYDMLNVGYREEVARVARLHERLRFISRACDDPNTPSDPRAETIGDVARKALLL
jgi:hypothetical protein